MEKKIVLVTDRLTPEAFLTLQGQSFLDVRKSRGRRPEADEVRDVHALLIRSQTPITRELLQSAKNLQLIVTATTGFDHIDLEACAEWGITVMHCPWANVPTTAQLTWALVLACVHKVIPAHQMIKAGGWDRHSLESIELQNKTYGIIGLGRIGSRVAEIASAFGMHVVAFDPYCDDKNFIETGAERVSFEECLKRSDIISFHVPLTDETHHMLKRSQLEFIHRGMIVVNTSRGPVISEPDLCDALDEGWIAACGLDVFEKEPLPRTSRLLQHKNVTLTPHIGAASQEAYQKASDQAALKILAFFKDGSTSETLPPKKYPSPFKNP